MNDQQTAPTSPLRDGKVVLCWNGATWPNRCVQCNEPAHGYRKRQQLSWHPSWVYWLILLGGLPYLAVAIEKRKTMDVEFGVCARHRRRRFAGIAFGWLGALATIGTCTASFRYDPPTIVAMAFLAIVACLVVGVVVAQLVTPTRIENGLAWVKCGRPFVESLPHTPER